MNEINFNNIANTYESTSLVQKSASVVLRDLLSIKQGEAVLDLGCGPGNITREVAQECKGRVVGVDVSAGMIEACQKNIEGGNLAFEVKDALELNYQEEFDVILCNSAFQWFADPDPVLQNCYNALRTGGRMGIQAPATRNYCPIFVGAVDKMRKHHATRNFLRRYSSPWLFLETSEEYANLFERNGFKVKHSAIVREETMYSVPEAFQIYQSGAENGYLNQAFYRAELTQDYIETFRFNILQTLAKNSDENGRIPLVFHRIYLVAEKV